MADDDSSRNADFVSRVVKDAKDPPETRMLTGWLGDAAEEGERRLYTNPELSCYIDIPTDAILHTEPIRDSQPPGGVFVWVQRDAALKSGGSAASRAARFLRGQVQEDFASGVSPEAAGLRCITKVHCSEPTGFTGQCTKQPEVGGAWPCITAVPHCFEPTGFTGKCTHQPWPNPTHYFGCTFLHCPTHDLTHVQQICHIVATGMPGCPVVNPPEGGDPELRKNVEGGEAERAAAPTSLPGCGYTRVWGLCQTLPPKCNVSVDIPCITQTETPRCFGGGFTDLRVAVPGPTIPINTQLTCNISEVAGACPTLKECLTKPPTAIPPCTQIGHQCPTPATTCTQIGIYCPTSCGPNCQTQQVNCTQMGEICLTHPVECTQFGTKCPSVGVPCPTPDCTKGPVCPPTQVGPACHTPTPPVCYQPGQAFRAAGPIGPTQPSGDCTFFGGCPPTPATTCTQIGPHCCVTYPNGDCTFFGGCSPTPATTCTQTFQCGASAVDACPTRLCGGGDEFLRAAAQIPSRLCQVQFWFTTVERICL